MPLIFPVEPKSAQTGSAAITDVLGAGPINVTGTSTKTVSLDGDAFAYAAAPVQGRIYRLDASGQLVLAQADAFANCDGIVGPYQGTANRAQNLRGKVVQVFAAAGLTGLVSPQPIFLSMGTAGVVTNVDPYDAPVVGAHSVLLGFLVDASVYNALTGGFLSIVWAPLLPSPPLGTGATPPTNPPFYVDEQTYPYTGTVNPGDLIGWSGASLQRADNTTGVPAQYVAYDTPAAGQLRKYQISRRIARGGFSSGQRLYLGTAGQPTATAPALPVDSGKRAQIVGWAEDANYVFFSIDPTLGEVLP